MSYHQGSSYRPGGDLYRPGSRQNNSGHGNGYRPLNNFQNRQRHDDRDTHGGSYNSYGAQSSHGQNGSGYGHGGSSYGNKYVPRQGGTRQQAQKPHNTYHLVYSQTQAENQLWMGDLDPAWTEQDIADIWVQAGEPPVGTKIMKDKAGRPQYCFVTFSSLAIVASAIQKNRTRIPGSNRLFKLNWASGSTQGQPGQGRPAHGERGNNRAGGGSRLSPEYSVFIGDLGLEVTEPVLFAKFNSEYPGVVKLVKIMVDATSGASKGFGFVRFTDPDAQQRALTEMNGAVVGLRPIRVGLANGPDGSTRKGPESLEVQIPQQQPSLGPSTDPNNTVLAIGGVTSDISRDDLLSHFLAFGDIVYCQVNHQQGTAHIKYLLRGAAQRAFLYMHGLVVCGSRITLRWGSEEATESGKLRFQPLPRTAKYKAAQKPPAVYGHLPNHVAFDLLSAEEAKALEFVEDLPLTVEKIDERYKNQIDAQKKFLETAF